MSGLNVCKYNIHKNYFIKDGSELNGCIVSSFLYFTYSKM